jgi:xanthine/uracil permease
VTNELGSIEAVGQMLDVPDMAGRIKRGVGLQGLTNVAAGGLAIIGPVDYSLSAGLIAATGCASRYTLVPAGLGLLACAFFPGVILLLARMPEAVMGLLLLYLMSSQLASGLSMLVSGKGITDFSSGLTVGLPLMVGLLIAYSPATAFADMPGMLRPILANGFVMGTITVMLLEHVIFRGKAQ